MSFSINQMFEDQVTGHRIKLLHADADADLAVTIRCGPRFAAPKPGFLTELRDRFECGRLVTVAEVSDAVSLDERLVDEAALTRFKLVEPAVDDLLSVGMDALSRKFWSHLRAAAKKIQYSPHGLYAVISKVLQAGGVKAAAVAKWHRCGAMKIDEIDGRTSLRVTRKPRAGVYPLAVADVGIIKAAAEKKVGRTTWQECYDEMLDAKYRLRIDIVDGKETPIRKPRGQRPSWGQFYRIARRHLRTIKRYVLQDGELGFQQNHRGKPVGAAEAQGPGIVAEADWTFTDLVVVRRGNRYSIGRLVVYVVVDKFTGEILSIYLTLATGRHEEAARAILLCLEDKVDLCARYGLAIRPSDWPVQHLPASLVTDKGEIDSWKSTGIATGLGITLVHAPSKRPDLKGTVESVMASIRKILLRMRGATSGVPERCKKDPNVTAVFDFDQLYKVLLAFAVWHNKRVRKNQPMTLGMVSEAVLPVPNRMWEYAIRSGCLRTMDLATARVHALPWHSAAITERGIRLNNLRYQVPDFAPTTPGGIDANEWLAKARKERWKVDLALDPATVDHVWLRHSSAHHAPILLKCPISPGFEGYEGLSWQECKTLIAAEKESLKDYVDGERADSTRDFRAVTQETEQAAIEQTGAARAGMSAAEQSRGVGHNRAEEERQRASAAKRKKPGPQAAFDSFLDAQAFPHAGSN